MAHGKIWNKLQIKYIMKNNYCFTTLSDALFDKYAYKTLSKISENITIKGKKNKAVHFSNVDSIKFCDLIGNNYCMKTDSNDGLFYIDNINICYRYNTMKLKVNFNVCHCDNAGNRMRACICK